MKRLTTRGLVIVGSLIAMSLPASAQDFPGSGFLCSTLSIGCPPPPPPPPPPAPVVEEPAPVKKVRKHRKKKAAPKVEKKEAPAAQ